MAKKKSKTSRKVGSNHETNAKAVLGFLVLLVALSVLLIFNTYKDNIINTSSFQLFVGLAAVLFAFLLGLLFLVNPQRK